MTARRRPPNLGSNAITASLVGLLALTGCGEPTVVLHDLAADDGPRPAGREAQPPPRSRDGDLLVPPGGELVYWFDLPAGGTFESRAVVGGEVLVDARWEDGERRWRLAEAGGPFAVPVAPPGGGVTRLALSAAAGTSSRLVGAEVRGPAPVPGPAVEVIEGERRPHLVVYLVDTLRADRLGSYRWASR